MAAEDTDLNRGPTVGVAVGGAVGAVVGGLAGKAAAEAVNPTAEEAHWRERYASEPYYEQGRSFDDYAPAYRLGLAGRTHDQIKMLRDQFRASS